MKVSQVVFTMACLQIHFASAAFPDVGIVARVEQAIQKQLQLQNATRLAAADSSIAAVEHNLDDVMRLADAEEHSQRTQLLRKFEEFRREALSASRNAALANNSEAITAALNSLDAATQKMRNVSRALDVLGRDLLQTVRRGLKNASEPALSLAREVKRLAARLQHRAHRILDPLYNMGDGAEDLADGFNDRVVEAEEGTTAAAERLSRQVQEHVQQLKERAQGVLADESRERVQTVQAVEATATRVAGRLVALEAASIRLAGDAAAPSTWFSAKLVAMLAAGLVTFGAFSGCSAAQRLSSKVGRLEPLLV